MGSFCVSFLDWFGVWFLFFFPLPLRKCNCAFTLQRNQRASKWQEPQKQPTVCISILQNQEEKRASGWVLHFHLFQAGTQGLSLPCAYRCSLNSLLNCAARSPPQLQEVALVWGVSSHQLQRGGPVFLTFSSEVF